MVVAGACTADGSDIAVMMVEAGGTEKSFQLLRRRRPQGRRGRAGRGPRRVQEVDPRSHRHPASADRRRSGPVRRWLRAAGRLHRRHLGRGRRRRHRSHHRDAEDRRQVRAPRRRGRGAPSDHRRVAAASSPTASRPPRSTSRPPSARSPRRSCARASSKRASASTVAACAICVRSRPRSGVIPTAHGSGLFNRGETQVLNFAHARHAAPRPDDRRHRPDHAQALHAPLQHGAVLDR